MSSPALKTLLLSSVAMLFLGVACSVADIPGSGDPAAINAKGGVDPNGTAAGEVACTEGEPTKLDITKLAACECKAGGKAHCVNSAKMPKNMSDKLAKCDADKGRCIPDTIIESEQPPPVCKSGGKDGRCLSMCVPLVEKYGDRLNQGDPGAACAADEKCVPCISPLDDSKTGVCELSALKPPPKCAQPEGGKDPGTGIGTSPDEPISCPFTGTPVVSNKPTCGEGGGGRCIDATAIPKDIAARLKPCDGATLCVPEVYVREKGQHKPAACKSFAGIEGRCFSVIFKDVDEQKEFLGQDACAAGDRCVPCFNPATGAETNPSACRTVSCDAPTTVTPPKLVDCCSQGGAKAGKCLPRTDVPTKYQTRVERKECTSTELCVPAENLNPETKVQKDCDFDGEKSVCVSDCIKFGFLENIVLDRGKCAPNHTCVPCTDLRGAPTGAPGC